MTPINVLFLCTGNSARSILAEAILNRAGAGRFRAFSAGSMPTGQVNPHALSLLRGLGYPTDGLRSKPWEEFAREANPDAPDLRYIFTVCDNAAGEVCPIWPGRPITAHWGLPDPAAAGPDEDIGAAFAETYSQLSHRIGLLINLPLGALDSHTLHARLRGIGHTDAPTVAVDG